MIKMNRDEFEKLFVRCDNCGYRNRVYYLKRTGLCHCCKKVLDKRAKMEHEIMKRSRKNGIRFIKKSN